MLTGHFAIAEVSGIEPSGNAHGHGFGGGHDGGGGFNHGAAAGFALAQVLEGGDEEFDHVGGDCCIYSGFGEELLGLGQDELLLQHLVSDGFDGFEVEAAFEGAGHFVDATVSCVGGGDEVEAFLSQDGAFVAELRDGHDFVGEDGDEGVLDFGGAAGDFFEADKFAVF